MLDIKKRIENLQSSTNDIEVKNACLEALDNLNTAFNTLTPQNESPFNQRIVIEEAISESLMEKIKDSNDIAVKDFIHVEKRISGMHNLGVKEAIKNILQDDIASNVSVKYIMENLKKMFGYPEWQVAHVVVESLKQFEWSPVVKENIKIITENINKFKEDIKIYNSVLEVKNSSTNFLMSGLEREIENYLNHRTATNRSKLLETLNKFTFDPAIKNLYNIVVESANGFQIKGNSNDAYVKNVYSPVFLNENNEEFFTVYGKPYIRINNDVRPLTETEIQHLPTDFMWLSDFLIQPNVQVSENTIKIFSRDKKIELTDNQNTPTIKINEKEVTINDFEKIYLNSGVFNQSERPVLSAVHKIVENWDSIFELDYIKSIFSHSNPHRRVDVFRCGNNIHMNKVDSMMNENIFISDCNGLQSRNLVLEFINYDLGNTFSDLLSENERTLNELTLEKQQIFDSISYLEKREKQLRDIPDTEIRESAEVIELLDAITEEIDSLKQKFAKVSTEINDYVSVKEGVDVKDEVEVLKKKD